MTSKELQYVVTIADEKSFNKAADKLHISQPSLTQTIHRLEDELGFAIFTRTAKGSELTEHGKKYYEMAVDVLARYDRFEKEISCMRDAEKKELRLGASWYITTFYLPDILRSFKENYPYCTIDLTEKNSSDLEYMLKENKLDLIFAHRIANEFTSLSKQFETIPLKTERIYIAASKALNLSQYAKDGGDFPLLDPQVIKDIPVVKFNSQQRVAQAVELFLKQAEIDPPVLFKTYGFQSALELAASNNGITFLPDVFVRSSTFQEYPVEVFDVSHQYDLYWSIQLVYHHELGALPEVAYLTSVCREYVS